MKTDLTTDERHRVINDIAAWKQELHMNDGLTADELEDYVNDLFDLDDEALTEWEDYVNDLFDLDDEALTEWWEDTIGEWILSRDDVVRQYDEADGQLIIDDQFARLISPDGTTAYGYINGRPSIAVHLA